MGRKKKQQGKTIPGVGEASGNKQQEIMADDNSDKVHTNEGEDDSECYADWTQLGELFISHLSFRSAKQPDSAGEQPPPEGKAADVSILVPACGRATLSENLYDAGFKNITNLDKSMDVITDMLRRNVRERPEMKWRVVDMTEMQFEDETIDAIVDKGGLDSLMEPTLGGLYLDKVKKVLKAGGKYVCLTLAKRHVLDLLFPSFRFGWDMSLYAIGQKASSRRPKLQTIMVVAEKRSSPDVCAVQLFVEQNVFESNSDQARDFSEALLRENEIRSKHVDGNVVNYSVEDLHLGADGDISKLSPGRRVNLSLGRGEGFIDNGVLLDAKEDSRPFICTYAVLLIPHNRASDWIYAFEEGQRQVVKNTKASRLLMFFLDSRKSDVPLYLIQKELSPHVKKLKPETCHEGYQTPYLRAGDRAKKRKIVYQGSSGLIGSFVVEDVTYDDDCECRRLIFKRTESLAQSEALLLTESTDVGKEKEQKPSEPKKKGKQRKSHSQSSKFPVSSSEVVKVDHNNIRSGYHIDLYFGILLISSYLKVYTSAKDLVNTVIIGLGGGLLPMFMKKHLPFLKIEVVELDDKVLEVARKYFDFCNDESIKVHITDGIKFVKEKAAENSSCKTDILIVDVDTSNTSSALTSPAADFVDESFLLNVKDLLSEQGLFIINLAGSSYEMNDVRSKLKKVFSCILSLPIEEDNDYDTIVFAFKKTTIKEDQLSEACELAKSLGLEKKWSSKLLKLVN